MQFIAGIRGTDAAGGPVYTTAGNGTAFTIVVYKTFVMTLNMVNQLFDIKNKFYTLAYTRQVV